MARQKGFSLIEVSVGVMLLAMVLIGSYRLVVSHLSSTNEAGQSTQAYYLAEQALAIVKNDLKNDPYTIALPADGSAHYPNFITKMGHIIAGTDAAIYDQNKVIMKDDYNSKYKIYYVTIYFKPGVAGTAPTNKLVEVKVSWENQSITLRSFTL